MGDSVVHIASHINLLGEVFFGKVLILGVVVKWQGFEAQLFVCQYSDCL